MVYSPAAGWHKPQLLPREQFTAAPGAAGSRHGRAVAEVLQVFRRIDGTIAAFRPWEHSRRLRRCAQRAAMPELPDDLFVSAVEELVEADAADLAGEPGSSLYLCSQMFPVRASQDPHPPRDYGFALTAQRTCTAQVAEPNLFLVRAIGPRTEVLLLEPETTALPGVMAESVLTLASRLGYLVRREGVPLDQWRQAHRRRVSEAFACGTAAGVVPVGDGEAGPVTAAVRRALSDVRCGRDPGPRGWMYQIPAAGD